MVNCPNCGAPIEPYKCKCEYCGTWYYDLTGIDLTNEKPCYVKFRTNMDGVDVDITTLAKPHLESFEMQSDTVDICSPMGTKISSISSFYTYCDINMRFECYKDQETDTFFRIEVSGNDNT